MAGLLGSPTDDSDSARPVVSSCGKTSSRVHPSLKPPALIVVPPSQVEEDVLGPGRVVGDGGRSGTLHFVPLGTSSCPTPSPRHSLFESPTDGPWSDVRRLYSLGRYSRNTCLTPGSLAPSGTPYRVEPGWRCRRRVGLPSAGPTRW